MKFVLALLLGTFLASVNAQSIPQPPVLQDNPSYVNWQPISEWHFNADNPIEPYLVFLNTYTGQGAVRPGVWYEVDVTQPPYNLPTDVKEIFAAGRIIITQGAPGTANFELTIRTFGSALPGGDYQFQADSTGPLGTARTDMATYIPITNGKFEFYWTGNIMAGVSYGLNLSLQGWGR
jgi:hypothetical protein